MKIEGVCLEAQQGPATLGASAPTSLMYIKPSHGGTVARNILSSTPYIFGRQSISIGSQYIKFSLLVDSPTTRTEMQNISRLPDR